MKHKILSFILLALCTVAASAGVKDATTLCIENSKGETVKFALIESPKMTFKSTFVIVQASETKIFRFKEIASVYFTDEETGINDATTDEEVSNRLNTVSLTKFAANTAVRVYTPAGMIVKQTMTDADGSADVSTSDLPRGTYIIKAGKTAFKFIRR
jgi:hypothetical protein